MATHGHHKRAIPMGSKGNAARRKALLDARALDLDGEEQPATGWPAPGMHRHWFNDIGGRVQAALAAGWVQVEGPDGKPLSRPLAGHLVAYALEYPEPDWLDALRLSASGAPS